MAQYRRKVTAPITAVQWAGNNLAEVTAFVGPGNFEVLRSDGWVLSRLRCASSSTWLVMDIGDWVLPELDGSGFYKCDADVFEATYEAI